MRNIARSTIILLLMYAGCIYAQSNLTNWETYSIPNVCSFKVPPTMEIRLENSFHGRFVKSMHQSSFYEMLCDECDIFLEEAKLVLQPKGLNGDPFSDDYRNANNSYGRIIFRFSYDDILSQNDIKDIDPSELRILDTMWRNEVKEGLECIGQHYSGFTGTFKWYPLRKENYSGLSALVVEYDRPGTGVETHVREYKFFYKDRFLLITTSYNLKQETKYKEDFKTFMKLLSIEANPQTRQTKQSNNGLYSSEEYHISFTYDPNKFSEVKRRNNSTHCFYKLEANDGSSILFSAWDLESAGLIPIHDDEYVNEMKQRDKQLKGVTVIESCEKMMIGNKKALRSIFRMDAMGIEYIYTSYRAYHKDRFYTIDFHIPKAKYKKQEVENMIKGLQFK